MATIPVAAKAPSKSKTGPNFPKSQESTSVKQAKDRGETSIGPRYCESTRAANRYVRY